MPNITKNTFIKGMISDISKTKSDQQSYDDALNIRLTTDQGRSTGAIVNIKGNEYFTSLPNTGNTINVTFNTIPVISTNYTVTINGAPFTFTYTGSGDIYSQFISFLSSNTSGYAIYNYGTSIGFHNTNNSVITITISGGTTTVTEVVSNQIDPIIIGFTNIRDEIILLSTSSTNINPTTNNISQIWRLTYNKQLLETSPTTAFTLKLLYNNNLDFSLTWPIAPSAISGNFEGPLNKKIYWCDYYNNRRTFNTADPNAFFLDPKEIFSVPTQSPSVPYVLKINEGQGKLPPGIYQYTYRLSNSSGAETRFYPLSAPMHIIVDSEQQTTGQNYVITGYNTTITNKSVSILIPDIDVTFDRIEILFTKKTKYTNVPDVISIIADEPIDKLTGIFTYEHTGTELEETVTLTDLINPPAAIKQYKTNAIKDNMLLIANVKIPTLDLDYDARAFRYNYSQSTYPANALPDIENDINPNQEPNSYNNYLYQQDGRTLGGTGTNISYSFKTLDLLADYDNVPGGHVYSGPPYKNTFKNSTPSVTTDRTYPNYQFDDQRSPYLENVTRGYQRGEIYRFAIQFFDLNGNPAWTKWIADIRMPDIYMPDTTQADPLTRTNQFPVGYLGAADIYWTSNLGIEFNVNIPSIIESQISGWSIVRVKREQKDKTILAQGLVQPAFEAYGGVVYLQKDYVEVRTYPTTNYDKQYATLISPETFFQTFGTPSGVPGEYLEIVDCITSKLGVQQPLFPSSGIAINVSALGKYYISTYRTLNSSYRTSNGNTGGGGIGKKFAISRGFAAEGFVTYNRAYSDTVSPRIYNTSPGNGTHYFSEGGIVYCMRFSSSTSGYTDWDNVGYIPTNQFVVTDGLPLSYTMYLGNYKRIVTKQYGGNTLTERSKNQYISCNQYQRKIIGTTSYTTKVFGGDVFVNIWDNCDQKKAWSTPADSPPTNPSGSQATLGTLAPKYMIVESCINVNLRNKEVFTGVTDPTVNTSYFPNDGTGLDRYESQRYNIAFSNENDIQIYLPKPVPFVGQELYDHRIYTSDVKTDGELVDGWNNFLPANYRDVDSAYGPINNLSILGSQVYFIQDRGFGLIPVNRVVLQVDPSGIETQLGKGNTLEKHQYISTQSGTQHQWSVLVTDKTIWWYDVLGNKQMRYSQNGLETISDSHGQHSFFVNNIKKDILNNDNPILNKGVVSVYDYENNEAIFTFLDGSEGITKTLVFSELTQSYSSRHSYTPSIYITNRDILISPSTTNEQRLYLHNYGEYGKFYDVYHDSYIRYLTNENPEITKVFNNIQLQTEVQNTSLIDTSDGLYPIQETFNTIRCFNDQQDSGLITLNVGDTIKRKFRSWRLTIPRDSVTSSVVSYGLKSRQRDKYLYTELYFTNNNNKRLILHDVLTGYLLSPY